MEYKFTDKIKESILKSNESMISLSNRMNTTTYGLYRMIKRDTQTLMHIEIIEFVSQMTNTPIKKLYEEKTK